MENICLEVRDDTLMCRANDMELGITCQCPVQQDDTSGPSGVLIKATTLQDVVATLKSDTIGIAIDDLFTCTIESGETSFRLLGLPVSEYPARDPFRVESSFSMDAAILLDLIKHTLFSVSVDETKSYLNGIQFQASANECRAVSTDGVRLSVKSVAFDEPMPDCHFIVPTKAVTELSKIINVMKVDTVQVHLSQPKVLFQFGSTELVSRLLHGRFPDYKQVIPSESFYEFKIPRNTLLLAVERANIIASHANFWAKFDFKDSHIDISTNNAKMGNYVDQVAMTRHVGESALSVTFNTKSMMDVLKIMDQQDIIIRMKSATSPCLIQPFGDPSYNYVLVPIRVSDYAVNPGSESVNAVPVASSE